MIQRGVRESLTCDRCGLVYTDQSSIQLAKKEAEEWKRLCEVEGVELRGLFPCPSLFCAGELMYDEGAL